MAQPFIRVPSKERSDVERGRYLFNRYGCFSCHGKQGAGGIKNNNAVGGAVPSLTYVAEGYTDEELKQKIRKGVPNIAKEKKEGPTPPLSMPVWKKAFTDTELDELVSYLISLKPKEEPEMEW